MNKFIILFFALNSAFIIQHSSLAQTLPEVIKLMENEQFEKASDAFISIIQREPTNGDAYFYYGENIFRQEIIDSSFKEADLDSARAMFEKGKAKNPGNPLNYVGIGKSLWYEGKTAEAKKQFYDATQIISPANKSGNFSGRQKAMVYMKIAETYIKARNKDLPEAINLLNKALKEDKDNPEVYILIGDATLEQNPGDASQAIGHYKKAYDLDKKSSKALLRIGVLYSRARNLTEAVKNYDEAIKVEPNYAPAYREKAEAFYRGKQYETAIQNYRKYLELNSGSLSAKVRYASFLFLNKKYSDAVSSISEIMKENPNIIFLYRLLAYSHYELGNCNDGIPAIEQFFQKANEKKILSSDYEYYGKLLSKCGRDSLAIEKLRMAAEKDTLKSELWGEIGNAYMKMKKYPETIDAFKRKIKSGKGVDVNDYYVLGRAYYYNKQFGQADTVFAEIVKLRPDIPTGYQWRAKANAGMDPDTKKGLAKPFYEEYTGKIKPEETDRNKPGLVEAYEYLGYYHMLAKDYPSAKCVYTKLKEIDPNNVKAKKALGDANLQKAVCPQ